MRHTIQLYNFISNEGLHIVVEWYIYIPYCSYTIHIGFELSLPFACLSKYNARFEKIIEVERKKK